MADGQQTPNVSGMVADPDFQGLAPADKRAALGKLTGDTSFSALSDAETMQFVSRFTQPKQGQIPDATAQARQAIGNIIPAQPQPTQYRNAPGTPLPPGTRLNPRTGLPMREGDPTGVGTLNALPGIGGGIGGALGNVPGAALGGIAGEGLRQMMLPLANAPRSENPPAAMLGQGALQGTFEGGGRLIGKAGAALAPQSVKGFVQNIFRGKLDEAGQAIDRYLTGVQGTVSLEKPVNAILDREIGRAQKAGAESLADRLSDLKDAWNKNYNLKSMSPLEANQFRRDIGKLTSFAGEANKVTINNIQRQVVGAAGDAIETVAPGVKPFNDAYANLIAAQQASKGSVKKAYRGFTGVGLTALGKGLEQTGRITPTAIRGAQIATQENK
jgi:hypothetical protein